MRRRSYLFGGLVCSALLAVWSCGLDDTSVVSIDDSDAAQPDAAFVDGAKDSSPGDGGFVDSGSDTGSDTGVVDAGPCPATDLPICDDGTCGSASEVCTPPVSAGWTVLNYISGSRPACSAGYAPHDVVEIADGGPAACACSCTHGDPPSCQNDNVVLGSGNATCSLSQQTTTMSAGCAPYTLVTAGGNYQATVTTSTACSALLDASIPTPDGGLDRECTLQPDAGAANLCADHRSCVAKPATGSICIAHASPATCPSGFTEHNVADSFSDSRSCPQCSCGWNATGCGTPVVAFHSSATCTPSAVVGADVNIPQTSCGTISGTFASLGLTGVAPAAPPTCGVTDGGVVDGGVTETAPETVCCSN